MAAVGFAIGFRWQTDLPRLLAGIGVALAFGYAAVRGLILGPDALPRGDTVVGQVGLALLWATAITAVSVPLVVRAYRATT